jgi:hypothetical protein
MTDLITTNRGAVKKSLIQGYRVFTPWYWVAFDWACKVAAIFLAFILFAASISFYNNYLVEIANKERGDSPIWLEILGYGLGGVMVLAWFFGTCRAIYFLWLSRADAELGDHEGGSGWIYAIAIFFVAVLPFSSTGGVWEDTPSYVSIGVGLTVIVASIRLIFSPLPLDSIELYLKDRATIKWIGLTAYQSWAAKKELTNAMSEVKTQP